MVVKRRSALELIAGPTPIAIDTGSGSLPVTLTYITAQHIELVMSLVSVSELPLEILERILLPLHPTVIVKMKEVSSTT